MWFYLIPVGTCPIPFPIKSKIEKKILQIIGNQKLTEINNGITCNIQRLDAISTIPPTGKVSQSIRPVENLNPNF
jgi:hypothetical protein